MLKHLEKCATVIRTGAGFISQLISARLGPLSSNLDDDVKPNVARAEMVD